MDMVGAVPVASGPAVARHVAECPLSNSDPDPCSAEVRVVTMPETPSRTLIRRQMGHLGPRALDRVIKDNLVQGLPKDLPLSQPGDPPCEDNIMGKSDSQPFPSSQNPPAHLLAVIHLDIAGKFAVPGPSGERYFVIFMDGFTSYREVLCLQRKDQIPSVVIQVLTRWERQRQDGELRSLERTEGASSSTPTWESG